MVGPRVRDLEVLAGAWVQRPSFLPLSGSKVNVLPVDGNPRLGDRPTPTPSQSVDERQAPPGGLEEV